MLDLPHGGRSLCWIVEKGPRQLLLVPSLHAASIAIAAAGNQGALSHLHSGAQQFAASSSLLNATALKKHPEAAEWMLEDLLEDLLKQHEPLRAVFKARLAKASELMDDVAYDD